MTEASAGAGSSDDGEPAVPSDTAFWYRHAPHVHPADIATRFSKSENTVRRHWPPQHTSVNGDLVRGFSERMVHPEEMASSAGS